MRIHGVTHARSCFYARAWLAEQHLGALLARRWFPVRHYQKLVRRHFQAMREAYENGRGLSWNVCPSCGAARDP